MTSMRGMTLTEILSVEVKLSTSTKIYHDVKACGADSGTFYVKLENETMIWHNNNNWVSARSERRWEDDDA